MPCMESSVYDDRQFELHALGRSKPVETGKSIMLRATKTSDRPSCGVEDGLETVEQRGWETSQCRIIAWGDPLPLSPSGPYPGFFNRGG